jgi:hypothetical protein
MNNPADLSPDQLTLRASRVIWPPAVWPAHERQIWQRGLAGMWPEGLDNPAAGWRPRTLGNNQNAYGLYLSWLSRQGPFIEDEPISERITPDRLALFIASLKPRCSPVSVSLRLCADFRGAGYDARP